MGLEVVKKNQDVLLLEYRMRNINFVLVGSGITLLVLTTISYSSFGAGSELSLLLYGMIGGMSLICIVGGLFSFGSAAGWDAKLDKKLDMVEIKGHKMLTAKLSGVKAVVLSFEGTDSMDLSAKYPKGFFRLSFQAAEGKEDVSLTYRPIEWDVDSECRAAKEAADWIGVKGYYEFPKKVGFGPGRTETLEL